MNLDDLRTYLLSKTPINSLVIARISTGALNQNSTLPAIELSLISELPAEDLDDGSIPGLSVSRVRIRCYAATYSEAYAVKEAVRKAPMQQFRGTMGSTEIDSCFLDDENTFEDPPREGSSGYRYAYECDYRIAHRTSQPIFS